MSACCAALDACREGDSYDLGEVRQRISAELLFTMHTRRGVAASGNDHMGHRVH